MAGTVSIAILANASNAVKGFKDTETASQKAASVINKGAVVASVGFAAIGAGALKLAQGAAEDQQAAQRLATQLKNTTGATTAQVKGVEDWISAQERATGVTDNELRPVLGQLATATGSVSKAQQLASLAMDISAGSGKSLTAVSAALAKAQTGSVGGLAKYGVATKDATGKAKSLADIQDELAEKFKGQAAAQADTLAGKMTILKTQLGEAGESIGYELIPVLTTMANVIVNKGLPALTAVGNWMTNNKPVVIALGIAVGSIGAAFIAVSAAMKAYQVATTLISAATEAYTVVQAALNLVMDANPIALVVIAIAALTAGLVVAYNKVGGFHDAVNNAFTWLKQNWPLVLGILTGPIGLATAEIIKHWDSIVSTIKAAPGHIASAAKGMFDGIKDAFRTAIDFVIDGWNKLHFTMPSVNTHIPGVGTIGGWTIGLPQIPRLAQGGITTGPTVALIGDNPGGREAVVPLDKYDLGNDQTNALLKQVILMLKDLTKLTAESSNANTAALTWVGQAVQGTWAVKGGGPPLSQLKVPR